MERYTVEVDKQYLQFCSSHFILFKGRREPLHGHNFHCGVTLEGELTGDGYVLDFGDIKQAARQACDAIDHRVLLPGQSAEISVRREGTRVQTRYRGDLLFDLPATDVCVLPLANATTEQLARYLAGEIETLLPAAARRSLRRIAVMVEETPGQRARYEREIRAA